MEDKLKFKILLKPNLCSTVVITSNKKREIRVNSLISIFIEAKYRSLIVYQAYYDHLTERTWCYIKNKPRFDKLNIIQCFSLSK